MDKVVVLDIDNCLADFERQMVEYLRELYGNDAVINRDIYRLSERFDGKEVILAGALDFVKDQNSYYGLHPIEPMVELASLLEEQGVVLYLSSRPALAYNTTIRWLKKQGLLSNPTLHSVFCGVVDKADFLADLVDKGSKYSVEFIVEDSPENITSLKKNFSVITFDRPWNKGIYPRIEDRNGVLMYQAAHGERSEPVYEAFG